MSDITFSRNKYGSYVTHVRVGGKIATFRIQKGTPTRDGWKGWLIIDPFRYPHDRQASNCLAMLAVGYPHPSLTAAKQALAEHIQAISN